MRGGPSRRGLLAGALASMLAGEPAAAAGDMVEPGMRLKARSVGAPTVALTLDAFDQALTEAYAKHAPNFLAEHAYRLSQSFSKFYAACPVLAAPTPDLRASRLALAQTTLRQLETALTLLGIDTPERM